jgi:DNA-binding transcriptional LysR family regulator
MALDLEALAVVDEIERRGSFAAAAAHLGKVPSALTYTVRRLEQDLDVLIFDRRGSRARLTAAGQLLLKEGRELLRAAEDTSLRLRAIASGWETELRIALDAVIAFDRIRVLIDEFHRLKVPTQLRFSTEVLDGSWDALLNGRCDLAIGAPYEAPSDLFDGARFRLRSLGEVHWVFCVAPHHPLASASQPLGRDQMIGHRAVAIADTTRMVGGRTSGLLNGQQVITVATLEHKLALQMSGTGVGYLPAMLAKPYLDSGRLVALRIQEPKRKAEVRYGWHTRNEGKALAWWLGKLDNPRVRSKLLAGPITAANQ